MISAICKNCNKQVRLDETELTCPICSTKLKLSFSKIRNEAADNTSSEVNNDGNLNPHLCIHRGLKTGKKNCYTCSGNVVIKIFHCNKLNIECTILKPILASKQTCLHCKDFETT